MTGAVAHRMKTGDEMKGGADHSLDIDQSPTWFANQRFRNATGYCKTRVSWPLLLLQANDSVLKVAV
jgi:hypothetical protein